MCYVNRGKPLRWPRTNLVFLKGKPRKIFRPKKKIKKANLKLLQIKSKDDYMDK